MGLIGTRLEVPLNADCTGTKIVPPFGPHVDIFVALDGSGLTDVGFAVSAMDFGVVKPSNQVI